MPTKTPTPPTLDEATARLADVEHRVAVGQAGADELVSARAAVDAARLRAEHDARAADQQAAQDNRDAVSAEVAWLEGPDLAALVEAEAEAFAACVAAVAQLSEASTRLHGAVRQHSRRLRQLHGGSLPDGVTIQPLTGWDVEVTTPNGTWSTAGFASDPVAAAVTEGVAAWRGRAAHSDHVGRRRRWLARGRGQ